MSEPIELEPCPACSEECDLIQRTVLCTNCGYQMHEVLDVHDSADIATGTAIEEHNLLSRAVQSASLREAVVREASMVIRAHVAGRPRPAGVPTVKRALIDLAYELRELENVEQRPEGE